MVKREVVVVFVFLFIFVIGFVSAINSADRTLPSTYTPGVAVPVTLSFTKDPSTVVYLFEETAPTNWVVTNYPAVCSLVGNNILRCGPYYASSLISYSAIPPASETQTRTFSGMVSWEGSSSAIGSNSAIGLRVTQHHTLSVSRIGSGAVNSTDGRISCGITCSANYDFTSSVSLLATPSSGYFFAGWIGACLGTGACNLIMDTDKSVRANFSLGTSSFDFSLVNSGDKSAVQGGNAQNLITANLVSGAATQAVSFSASGLPTGATASFSFISCSPTCSTTLTIFTSATTPTGTSTIVVSATNGTVSRNSSFILTVSAVLTIPSAPSNLRSTSSISNSISLAWNDNSNNEDNFVLERALSSTGPWTTVVTLALNTVLYVDSGLTPGTTYYYRIKALNGAGSSVYSNVYSVSTTASAPSAPSNLAGSPTSTTSIQLTWVDNAVDEQGFKLERAPISGIGKGVNRVVGTFVQIATPAANAVAYTDNLVVNGNSYRYRIKAYNLNGESSYSNNEDVTINCRILRKIIGGC